MDSIRVQLARFRAARRWSQRALAKRLGCHQTQVSKIESGERRPGLDIALAIERLTEGAICAEHWGEADASASSGRGRRRR